MHFFSAVKKAEAFFPGAQLERDDVTFLARRKFPFLTGITVFEKLPKLSHLQKLQLTPPSAAGARPAALSSLSSPL